MSQQCPELGLKGVQEHPTGKDFNDNGHKEESGSVLKANNVDNHFGDEDEEKHGDGGEVAEGAHRPQALPVPVVVGKNCFEHREEGDAHGGNDKHLEVQPKAVEVVFFDQPVKPLVNW